MKKRINAAKKFDLVVASLHPSENVSKLAVEKGLSRQLLYNWQEKLRRVAYHVLGDGKFSRGDLAGNCARLEQRNKILEERVAQLEKFISENGFDVPLAQNEKALRKMRRLEKKKAVACGGGLNQTPISDFAGASGIGGASSPKQIRAQIRAALEAEDVEAYEAESDLRFKDEIKKTYGEEAHQGSEEDY